MSDTVDTQVQAKKSEPLFSKKNRRLISDPLDDNNPITVQVLGICSALAVTTQLYPAFIMSICVIFVMAMSNLAISMMRNIMPGRIRMIVQLIVIATLVTVVDIFLKAYQFGLSKQLSVFIGLIITNCIVMGRLEAFAMSNKPWPAFLDGIGNGLGYGAILIIVALFRELFGAGTLFSGTPIEIGILTETSWLGSIMHGIGYKHIGIMTTSAAAMFIIAIVIWFQRSRKPALVDVS